MSLIGEAVFAVTREHGALRINYEVLGNSWPHLHGHVHPRYEWEPRDKIGGPVWRSPITERPPQMPFWPATAQVSGRSR